MDEGFNSTDEEKYFHAPSANPTDSWTRSPRPAQTHSRAGLVAHLALTRARTTRRRHVVRNDDRPRCVTPPLAPRRRVAARRRTYEISRDHEPSLFVASPRASLRPSQNLTSDRIPLLSSLSGQGYREPRRRGPEVCLCQGYAPRTTTPRRDFPSPQRFCAVASSDPAAG